MKLVISASYAESAKKAADQIAGVVRSKKNALLGLATGSTPIPVYAHLVEGAKKGNVDFSAVRTTNLDEYRGLSGDNDQSYLYFMRQNLLDAVGIPLERVTIPRGDAEDPVAELARLQAFAHQNPTDIQLLGIGVNGHVGFNEPGNGFHDGYHIVTLTQSTIDSNSRLFARREDVPTQAYTMGIGNIIAAKSIVLIATGDNKRDAVKAILETGDVSPQVQATILKFHPDCTIYLDQDLMAGIAPAPEVDVVQG